LFDRAFDRDRKTSSLTNDDGVRTYYSDIIMRRNSNVIAM